MIAKVLSAFSLGLEAHPVEIEVDVCQGLPQLIIVGLPDTSVKESRERVRSAIKNSQYPFPQEKITINLAPADTKKEGSVFDLPIALGILATQGIIKPEKLLSHTFLGELALDGHLRPFHGALIVAESLKKKTPLILPSQNAEEASLCPEAKIYGAQSLSEVVEFLNDDIALPPAHSSLTHSLNHLFEDSVDFGEVKGQHFAKRAAEIAVAGGHNLLMIGSPGAGKTMIARRIPTLLPRLSRNESVEITKIYSAAGLANAQTKLMGIPPFRNPHHSISPIAMSGGGSIPKPGEVSLAHSGVLFLDELPEFKRETIEMLRTPLEEGTITISRTKLQLSFPCKMLLVAAMNPCPCGYLLDPRRACRCSMAQIQKYRGRISGPMLDRIDLHVEVPTLTYETLTREETPESSEKIRERILQCRAIQRRRFRNKTMKVNARMKPREIKECATPDSRGLKLIETAMRELHLSARGYYKILKIARTLADLAESEKIRAEHIAEAIQYRSLDRQW